MRIGGEQGYLPYRPSATIMASAMSAPPSIEEVGALRTPELDRYLPPRRLGPSAYESRRRVQLQFVHSPIVDLSIPQPDRCAGRADVKWGGVGFVSGEGGGQGSARGVGSNLHCSLSTPPYFNLSLMILLLLPVPHLPLLPRRLRLLLAELAERLANGEQLYIHW